MEPEIPSERLPCDSHEFLELSDELASLRNHLASVQAGASPALLEARIERLETTQVALNDRLTILEKWKDLKDSPHNEQASSQPVLSAPATNVSFKAALSAPASTWCCVRMVTKTLHRLDRWGYDESPRPKLVLGGIVSLLLFVALCVYTVILYTQYDELQPSVSPTVLWSISDGPYHLPIKCFAQECLVSVDLGTVDAGSHGCISKVPDSQLNHCFILKQGEEVVVHTCYSLLPTQGVHVQFIGPVAWQELAPKYYKELGADDSHYGFASVSDMLGEKMPVMKSLTPIRIGSTVLDFVKTKNHTRPAGSSGAIRQEWFSLLLSNDVSPAAFVGSPCNVVKAAKQGNSSEWKQAILTMAPQWTEIVVSPPPSWISAAIGEVGGAFEVGEIIGAAVLIGTWQLGNLMDMLGVGNPIKSFEPGHRVSSNSLIEL